MPNKIISRAPQNVSAWLTESNLMGLTTMTTRTNKTKRTTTKTTSRRSSGNRTNKKGPIKLEVGRQGIEPNHAVCVASTWPRAETNMMSAHSLSLSSNRRM